MSQSSPVLIQCRDGFKLKATIFNAPAEQADVIILPTAIGVPQRFYRHFAQYLAEQGFTTITFDYRGMFQSGPRPQAPFQDSVETWGKLDLAAIIDWAHGRFKPNRMLLIGHSMGGKVLAFAHNADRINAVVTVTVGSGYFGHHPRFAWLLAMLWYILVPTMTKLFGYFPGKRFRIVGDLPAGVAIQWSRWCRHREYVVDDKGVPLATDFARIQCPILSYSFADDKLISPAAIEALHRYYCNAQTLERRHIDPKQKGLSKIGHFGFFLPEMRGSGLWEEVVSWLKQPQTIAN